MKFHAFFFSNHKLSLEINNFSINLFFSPKKSTFIRIENKRKTDDKTRETFQPLYKNFLRVWHIETENPFVYTKIESQQFW